MITKESKEGEAPGQNKEFNILVNGAQKIITGKEITFKEVIELAYGSISEDPNVKYTVTYERGEGNKPEGTMVKSSIVKVKEGMIFDATETGRS